jgi:hypothetical protein
MRAPAEIRLLRSLLETLRVCVQVIHTSRRQYVFAVLQLHFGQTSLNIRTFKHATHEFYPDKYPMGTPESGLSFRRLY